MRLKEVEGDRRRKEVGGKKMRRIGESPSRRCCLLHTDGLASATCSLQPSPSQQPLFLSLSWNLPPPPRPSRPNPNPHPRLRYNSVVSKAIRSAPSTPPSLALGQTPAPRGAVLTGRRRAPSRGLRLSPVITANPGGGRRPKALTRSVGGARCAPSPPLCTNSPATP